MNLLHKILLVDEMVEHELGELLGVGDEVLQLLHRQVHEGGVRGGEHRPRTS